jgi:homocysteine S-methyltransferase
MILDGALATELERRGADLRDPLWSAKLLVEQPDLISAVHRDYFEAGADLATTASYQATFEGFAARGIDAPQASRLMQAAVGLARRARDEFWSVTSNRIERRRPLIAASVGPYGAMLADGSEYRGHYDVSDASLRDFHRRRLEVLATAGADLLACETIPSLREAIALVEALREFPTAVAWISFSCRDGEHTNEGQAIAECATRLNDCTQIVAIGVNCTAPVYIRSLLRHLRSRTDKPLIAYPNLGEHYDATAKHWHGTPGASGTPGAASFAAQARTWFEHGARLIGGCCRTTPDDIRAIKDWARQLGKPAS